MAKKLSFARPPVRSVVLSVFLQPLAKLRTLDLAPLRVEWRHQYPELQELTPLPSWGPQEPDSVQFVQSGLSWPMPLCVFATESGDRRIRFQHDRFILAWIFEPESDGYPGFDTLKSELSEKLERFSKLSHEAVGEIPEVKRISVEYSNNLLGIAAHEAMAGVLTGWNRESSFPFGKPDYSGFRVHYCDYEDHPNIGVLVGVDSAVGESAEEEIPDSSNLTLSAEADVESGSDFWGALEEAHDVVTSVFGKVTSERMRREWGEK
ncbi:TIGR04255 family protein [Streptomyces adelaidensis]|uniref:TIGR04255 family protein n=1 Tax=Streptomyces adelaidensis TaxID=2796465 RepID=UPI001905A057|nr:TIGR04255 family protein [Streptomyces adelaidensis]